MNQIDTVVEIIVNGAANLILWILGLVFFWTVQPRGGGSVRRPA